MEGLLGFLPGGLGEGYRQSLLGGGAYGGAMPPIPGGGFLSMFAGGQGGGQGGQGQVGPNMELANTGMGMLGGQPFQQAGMGALAQQARRNVPQRGAQRRMGIADQASPTGGLGNLMRPTRWWEGAGANIGGQQY